MAMLRIGGADMPAPSEMKITVFDLSSGGERSASGAMVCDRIAVKRKMALGWACLSGEELGRLLNAVEEAFFTVEYPDPADAAARSMVCACGDRVMGVLRMEDGAPVWTNVEMSFVEA